MKILFLGDSEGIHACLASELRRSGHDVTVVSDERHRFQSPSDIVLKREPGFRNSVRYLFAAMEVLQGAEGYDVVQLIGPRFFDLRAGQLRYFVDRLRRKNGALHLTLAGDDRYYVEACLDGKAFHYSEFRTGEELTRFARLFPRYEREYIDGGMTPYTRRLYDLVDGAIAFRPEYRIAGRSVFGDRLRQTALPLDLTSIAFDPVRPEGKVRLFVNMDRTRDRHIRTGREELSRFASELAAEYPDRCEAIVAENPSPEDYQRAFRSADVILDNMHSFSPGLEALKAMAAGKVVATGASPEYFEAAGASAHDVLIPLSPLADNKETLRRYILDPFPLEAMSRAGRHLVETHHDVTRVAREAVDY